MDVTVLFAARTGALQKLGRRYTVLPIEAKVGGSQIGRASCRERVLVAV